MNCHILNGLSIATKQLNEVEGLILKKLWSLSSDRNNVINNVNNMVNAHLAILTLSVWNTKRTVGCID